MLDRRAAANDLSTGLKEAAPSVRRRTYALWLTIFGSLTVAMSWKAAYRDPTFWQPATLSAAITVFMMLWLGMFRIRITDHELEFRSLFGGVVRTERDGIRRVSLGFHLSGGGGPLRLTVDLRDGSRPMVINAKVFAPEAIRAVLDLDPRKGGGEGSDFLDGIVVRTLRRRQSRK
jgi:hypothetical protein